MAQCAEEIYGAPCFLGRFISDRDLSGNAMSRAPFQVLAFLCRQRGGQDETLLLKRADLCVWQGVAGGGERDAKPSEAAIREICEETGVEEDNGDNGTFLKSLLFPMVWGDSW